MMRSLWSGVTGLQAHQIAMDVEGNNIANVNTTGFKYSRANFADLMYQTSRISTAPQDELGGKNSMQIGLGTQVNTVTKIFKQGSVQTTDKETDLAIQGDGFFVISPDGGQTLKYTRDGNFTFDANGNFVNTSGYIIQGWLRDDATGIIDATGPIGNITIPPGLTTPANATSIVNLKANLSSGDTVTSKSPIYGLSDVVTNADGVDMGVVFNASGEALNLRDGQGVWMSYADAVTKPMTITANNETAFSVVINGTIITGQVSQQTAGDRTQAVIAEDNAKVAAEMAALINQRSEETGVVAVVENGNRIVLKNDNRLGTESNTKNIDFAVLDTSNHGLTDTKVITAYQYTYSSSAVSNSNHSYDSNATRSFNTTEDLRKAMQEDARNYVNYSGTIINENGTGGGVIWNSKQAIQENKNDGVAVTVTSEGKFVFKNPSGDAPEYYFGEVSSSKINEILARQDVIFPDGTLNYEPITLPNVAGAEPITIRYANGVGGEVITQTFNPGDTIPAGIVFMQDVILPQGSAFETSTGNVTITQAGDTTTVDFTTVNPVVQNAAYTVTINGVEYTTLATTTDRDQLLAALAVVINNSGIHNATVVGDTIEIDGTTGLGVSVSDTATGADVGNKGIVDRIGDGELNDHNMYLRATGLTNTVNGISENTRVLNVFTALEGILNSGDNERNTQNIYMASHAASIDVFDSLGSKHTLRLEFRKTGRTDEGGSEWSVKITVPEPGKINFTGEGADNEVWGTVRFNNDGSLATHTPTSISYTANNGSSPNQTINLNFGTSGQFNGMTSFDQSSNTSSINQDGYTGGDLNGIAIDETGTIVGSFTNGRSFGLGQIAMATFTNNEGLNSEAGNIFAQTANSGDPTIGKATTGGRGNIKASSLEMSNVDLSRSLTQLIIIQRGYQANSKTITTSDTMLETLINLKR